MGRVYKWPFPIPIFVELQRPDPFRTRTFGFCVTLVHGFQFLLMQEVRVMQEVRLGETGLRRSVIGAASIGHIRITKLPQVLVSTGNDTDDKTHTTNNLRR